VEIRVLLFRRFQFCIPTRQLLLHERILRFKVGPALLQISRSALRFSRAAICARKRTRSFSRGPQSDFRQIAVSRAISIRGPHLGISDPPPAATPALLQVDRQAGSLSSQGWIDFWYSRG
jgi:hypothetical protein